MLTDHSEEAAAARDGRGVLGVDAIFKTSRETRRALPPMPWYEERRRMTRSAAG